MIPLKIYCMNVKNDVCMLERGNCSYIYTNKKDELKFA